MAAARKSDDGSLIVVGATGATRDRRTGLQQPATGEPDWLIALDGATRKPTQALWHGRGAVIAIAISDLHVAAAGHGPVRVFARDAFGKAIELGGDLPTASNVAWAPDGAMLGAIGERTVAVWRTGRWDAPAASWQVGSDYQGAIAFHPTRPLLAIGNRDGHVRVYGVADAQLAQRPVLVDLDVGGPVSGLAFSPDGATLLVAAEAPAKQIKRFAITARL
jgi:WD40 repeat protein